MSKVRAFLFFTVLLLATRTSVNGQTGDTLTVLKDMINIVKKMDVIAYDYTEDLDLPDGRKDHVKGRFTLDKKSKIISNNCDAFDMLNTERWSYRADHKKHTVAIIDVQKRYEKNYRKKREQNLFANESSNLFFDSVLIKTAKVKSFTRTDDGVYTLSLIFPKRSGIQTMNITYNDILKMPVRYDITISRNPTGSANPKGVIIARMKAFNFTKNIDLSQFEEDRYFTITREKIQLKKYNSYKVI